MATYKSIITEKFTSYTNSIGEVFASGYASVSVPYQAFNKDLSSVWNAGVNSCWIAIKFNEIYKVSSYKITGNTSSLIGRNPKNWTFEGSNDGVNWDILDTQTNVSDWVDSEVKEFVIPKINQSDYSYYKLNISSNNSAAYTIIPEIDILEVKPLNKILIQLGSGEYCKQTRRFVSGEVVPTLSSGNEQGFKITANEFNSSTQVPLNAFDNNTTTTWRTVTQNKQGWLAVKLPESLNVISYYIKGTPSTWTFEGSSDGVNWTILDTQTNTNPESGKKYNINNNNDFLHYRINVQSVTSGSYVYVYDMQLYIEPIIQSTYLESNSEQNFINHGMDTDTEINLSAEMTNKIFIEQTPTILGEGKVFSKKIDTSKIPIKSVTIE